MTTATHGYVVKVLSSLFITPQSNTRNRESLISCLLKISLEQLIFGYSTFSELLVFTEFYFLERISLFYKLLLPFLTFMNCEGPYRGLFSQPLSIFRYYVCAIRSHPKSKEQICSSIVNEVIRGNFKLLYFFYEKILHTQKA